MTGDRGRLRVTFHHNWWAEGVIERMPRVRFGEIHLFNNYYSSSGNNYAIGAGVEAKVVVESNFFENVNDPHIFYSGEKTAQNDANGNHYVNTTGSATPARGAPFPRPIPTRWKTPPPSRRRSWPTSALDSAIPPARRSRSEGRPAIEAVDGRTLMQEFGSYRGPILDGCLRRSWKKSWRIPLRTNARRCSSAPSRCVRGAAPKVRKLASSSRPVEAYSFGWGIAPRAGLC